MTFATVLDIQSSFIERQSKFDLKITRTINKLKKININ